MKKKKNKKKVDSLNLKSILTKFSKKEKKVNKTKLPTTEELKKELKKESYKSGYKRILINTLFILLIVFSLSILLATLLFPVLEIYGTSMSPILKEGDIVVANKSKKIERGDVIAFYYNNRILTKRVIGLGGEWINIDEKGNVYINGTILDEPYVTSKDLGESDQKYPMQIPENTYFVIGDRRNTSIDSRNSNIGTIDYEDVIGEVIIKVWPIKRLKLVK